MRPYLNILTGKGGVKTMRVRKHNRKPLLFYISTIFFAISLSIIAYSVFNIIAGDIEVKNTISKWNSQVKIEEVQDVREGQPAVSYPPIHASDNTNFDYTQEINIRDDIFGIIRFPTLDEKSAILDGTGSGQLSKGVGHYKGTAYPGGTGNCVLTGHNDTVFKNLGKLKAGDQVLIETMTDRFKYKVKDTRIIDDSDSSCLNQNTGKTLTLITCYPFFYLGSTDKRYVVTAEVIEE